MGRREKPIDPAAGPVARFASELRALRQAAGGPTYRVMAKRAQYSVTVLADAAAGEKLPSLPVALAYVTACEGDPKEWEDRWREAARDEAALLTTEGEEEAAPPYRGLARFEAGDSDRFFGRDRLTDELEALVRAQRCVMVFGPSGSGKSSLLRAGLIPRLRSTRDPELRPAAIRILTPGPRPAHSHEKLFTPADGPDAPDGAVGETWLVVDQFEELFTLCHDHGQRRAFIELILRAQDPSSRLRVVLGVRADFYAQCLDQPGLDTVIRKASLPIGPMTPAELREAIIKPAAAQRLIVERALTARLIEEAADAPGGLPLLSHALLETWRRRKGRTLTLEAYEAAGGIHGAIAQSAEDLYTHLTPQQAGLARRVLLRLITPGEGSQDTRRPVDRTELDTDNLTETEVVLERLARARLITLDNDTVDLAHEALITAWPRLQRWIEQARERLQRHRRLTEAARNWQTHGCDAGALLRGTQLTEAEETFSAAERREELTPLERDFLHGSTVARVRGRRTRRVAIGTLALFMVLAVVAGAVAWQENQFSERQRLQAAARRIAEAANSIRSSDPRQAMRLSAAAWKIADTVETRSAMTGAMAQPEDDVFSVPTAAPVTDRFISENGRTLVEVGKENIVTWNVESHQRTGSFQSPRGDLDDTNVAMSSDAQMLALSSASEKGAVQLWDIARQRPRGKPFAEVNPHAPSPPMFSPNGRRLVITTDRAVQLWDTAHRRLLLERRYSHPKDNDFLRVVALSEDNQRVAWCQGDGSLVVWEGDRRQKLKASGTDKDIRNLCHWKSGGEVEFSSDGRVLALATAGSVRRWNIDEVKEIQRLEDTDSGNLLPLDRAYEIVLSKDGRFVAAASADGIVLWRVNQPQRPVFTHRVAEEPSMEQLRLDADARTVRYLEPEETTTVVRTLNLGRAVDPAWQVTPARGAAFSADGRSWGRSWTSGRTHRFTLNSGETGKVTTVLPGLTFPPDGNPAGALGAQFLRPLMSLSTKGETVAYGVVNTATNRLGNAGAERSPDRIRVWSKSRQRVVVTVTASAQERIADIALSPDGRKLVVLFSNHIEIWDTYRGNRLRTIHGDEKADFDDAYRLAISPKGRQLLLGAGQVFDVQSGRRTPEELTPAALSALAFSSDGRFFAAGDKWGRVTLWDGSIKHRLGTLPRTYGGLRQGPAESTSALAFSEDGDTLGVAGTGGTLQLWDTGSRQPVGSPLPTAGDKALSIVFTPDGSTVRIAGEYVPLQQHAIAPEKVFAAVCRRAKGSLSRADWVTHIPDVPYQKVC